MSLIKFGEYLEEAMQLPASIMLEDDEVIVEWSELDWNSLTIAERAELEAEAVNGWAMWNVGSLEETEDIVVSEGEAIYEYIQALIEEEEDDEEKDEARLSAESWLKEYTARNTMQRRKTQKTKDQQKFKNRGDKLKAKIERKKGGNKVKRILVKKKWMKKNKSKIKNAQKVYGGKVKSKFTKKK